MNDLILTCNTGGGHNSAAYAMQEYITSQGDNAVTLDFMKLKSERASRIVGGLYINMAKNTPRLFGFVYKLGEKISSPRHKSPVYFACKVMAKRPKAYLVGFTQHVSDYMDACDILFTKPGGSIKEQVEKGFELLHSVRAREQMQAAQAANRLQFPLVRSCPCFPC